MVSILKEKQVMIYKSGFLKLASLTINKKEEVDLKHFTRKELGCEFHRVDESSIWLGNTRNATSMCSHCYCERIKEEGCTGCCSYGNTNSLVELRASAWQDSTMDHPILQRTKHPAKLDVLLLVQGHMEVWELSS
nr:uncharacterized protein LOC128691745 [Cherax quadricarinatus]